MRSSSFGIYFAIDAYLTVVTDCGESLRTWLSLLLRIFSRCLSVTFRLDEVRLPSDLQLRHRDVQTSCGRTLPATSGIIAGMAGVVLSSSSLLGLTCLTSFSPMYLHSVRRILQQGSKNSLTTPCQLTRFLYFVVSLFEPL